MDVYLGSATAYSSQLIVERYSKLYSEKIFKFATKIIEGSMEILIANKRLGGGTLDRNGNINTRVYLSRSTIPLGRGASLSTPPFHFNDLQ